MEGRRATGGLGRGLAALIPPATGEAVVRHIPLDELDANPQQPRHSFDDQSLRDLAASVAEHGVLQPVIVMAAAGRYQLIAGERRARAARLAGLATIPAVVRTADEQQQLAVALVENIQRADLNAMDEARAFRRLIDEFGLTQDQVARRVGRSRPAITNTLRILDVHPDVQAAVAEERISEGHARAIAGLPTGEAQCLVLATVLARALSVRQTEKLVAHQREGTPTATDQRRPEPDPDLTLMEARIRDALGTRVKLSPGRRGGRITISWFDADDLARIVERLAGEED